MRDERDNPYIQWEIALAALHRQVTALCARMENATTPEEYDEIKALLETVMNSIETMSHSRPWG